MEAGGLLSWTESELTKTESTYLAEMHRQSPKEKTSKAPAVRRRKRPHAHLRVPHLEEVMSPVTTPTDEDVGHRIKHVAGACLPAVGAGLRALSSLPVPSAGTYTHALLLRPWVQIICYLPLTHHSASGSATCFPSPFMFLGPC